MADFSSERYSRQVNLKGFGIAGQEKLSRAKVLVVGAGGLGVPALQYLAGMGVGRIGILDHDVVSLSNLHRQTMYSTDEVGAQKAVVAARKLAALNPDILIDCHAGKLTIHNALPIIAPYDIVIDATDNFAARYLINDACVIHNKPFVYGAIHQFEGHLSVFNLADGPTYRCLFRTQPNGTEIADCNLAGVLGVVPGIIGCRQALEAVKIITGIGKNLSGSLLVMDFLEDEQYKMKIKAVARNKRIRQLQEQYEPKDCTGKAPEALTPETLRSWQEAKQAFSLIDVREAVEFTAYHIAGARHLSLSCLQVQSPPLENSLPVVLYCKTGRRSRKAALVLSTHQPNLLIYELEGGLDNWLKSYPAL